MSEPVIAREPLVPPGPAPAPRRRKDPEATRQRWAERLARFGTSQLSVAAFCAQEGISVPAFYAARRALRAATATAPTEQPQLLPVRLAHTQPTLEVLLPSGAILRWPADLDPDRIAALLRAVGAIPC